MYCRGIALIAFLFLKSVVEAQELYVFSDPASNIPAKSISAKLNMRLANNETTGKVNQRYQPELMLGLSKQVMVRVSTTFSDLYSQELQWESVKAYFKWRFYSNDDIHRHFRMAFFADGAFANHDMVYDEMNLDGDNSGIQGGIIGTQLIHKLAISGTLSLMRVFDEKFTSGLHENLPDQNALNYSLSAGYLLFPLDYANYDQVNLNIYIELLGMNGLDKGGYYLDAAPALQVIFGSATKLNIGARFETTSNMYRPAQNSYFLSLETSFLNVFRGRTGRLKQ
ncbi:hypothetical protein [Flavihumibacter fluvii]|uniref:hypothetical protein n=1 Tax=Flavihumibacter fluvii TaxID=2838157 RepID=UPI001BDEEB0B|nr:hypothetical protein [Flavihumibacter fluvii]ULQ53545.1 hypothetical protein KJS93_04325 [Flavihumibacter fluvii]